MSPDHGPSSPGLFAEAIGLAPPIPKSLADERQRGKTAAAGCRRLICSDDDQTASLTSHIALRIWLRLLTCHNQIETRLRTQLHSGFETSLPQFNLMARLYAHPEGLKMRDLSRLLKLTGSNITRLTEHLRDQDLITRQDNPGDRRTYFISLTPKGKAQFAEMATQYERQIVSLLSAQSEAELHTLSRLLGTVKDRLSGKATTA